MAATDDEIRKQAASWFARMRGPNAAEDRSEFESWRDTDYRNATAYRRVEENWRRSDVLRDSELLDSFRIQAPWWKRFNYDRPRVYAPALAVLVLIIFVGAWTQGVHRPASDVAIAQSSQIGEIRTVALADGSRVTLDTDSAVTELFNAGERTVRLDRGRARFDVVHDEARPFIVMAGSTQITDKGTVFDVRLLGRQVNIVLLRGSVEIRSPAAAVTSGSSGSIMLTAGQEATVPANRTSAITAEPARAKATWVNGMLDFDDAPLGDMLAEVNRYNTHNIVLGDPRLATLWVTGAFRANGPADIARNLAALFELRVKTDAQGNWILLPK